MMHAGALRARDAAALAEEHRADLADLPLEAVQGYPVPVLREFGVALAFPFFLAKGRPGQPRQFYEPRWVAIVPLTHPPRVEVERRDNGAREPLGAHSAPPGATVEDLQRDQERLMELLDQMLPPHTQAPPQPAAPAAVKEEFARLWARLEQRPIAPFYRSLNPAWFAALGL